MRTAKLKFLVGLAVSAIGLEVSATRRLGAEREAKVFDDGTEVDLFDVPLKAHRIAATLVEEQAGTEICPEWISDKTAFDSKVRVLQRLDLLDEKDPIYYEFRVKVEEQRMGFIIVPSGDFDFPVSHWSDQGDSPTERLDGIAGDAEVARYVKVDTLTYVAEDADGNMIAKLGDLPPKIETTEDLEELSDMQETESSEVDGELDNRMLKEKEKEKEKEHKFSLKSWADTDEGAWKELKSKGKENYKSMVKNLKKEAAGDWETDRLAETYGEGVFAGQEHHIALLFPDADIHVSGKGAKLVSTSQTENALIVSVLEADEDEEMPLKVKINYGNGKVEEILLTIVPLSQTPDGNRRLWTSWYYHWADGGPESQRIYGQFYSSPNNSGCASGCGPTAWAMLFGWVDYMAHNYPSSKWGSRKCIYRTNGGRYSSCSAVAPRYQDYGVKQMTWEIRNDVGTWCWDNSGATFPWDMINAYQYLVGRVSYYMRTDYNSLGITTGDLFEKARYVIRDKDTPVVIGTGWLTHYPLAYGYRFRWRTVQKCFIFCWTETEYSREFAVNNGWYGAIDDDNHDWVPASTWFVGEYA